MSTQLFVKTLTGKTITVTVNDSDTILSIKEQIESKEGVPTEQQRLIICGKEMEDDHLVSEYNLRRTIHLIHRLRSEPLVKAARS